MLLNKSGKRVVMQMANDIDSHAKHDRGIKQLLRLERMIDVVYAIVIWRIFMLIPKPAEANWAWAYAMQNRRLIRDDLSDAEARRMLDRTMAEPAAAIITIPCAFIGPWAWEVAWLSLIPITQFLKHRRRKQRRELETKQS